MMPHAQPAPPHMTSHIPVMPPHPQQSTPQRHPQQRAPAPGHYYPPPTRAAPPAPPSAKRFKPTPPHVGGDPAMSIDEEEDTSRGDMLDHLSPREIATTRYMQHHEWMEEVLGSAYSINKITPVDLGLVLGGSLEGVTMDLPKDSKEALPELKKRAEGKVKEMEDEMAALKERHKRRLEKIGKTSVFRDAERDLRGGLGFEEATPKEKGEDAMDVASPAAEEVPISPVSKKSVAEVVAEVEAATGKKIVPAQSVTKHELPMEEITKMGLVVASGDGNVGGDTVMANGGGSDGDSAFKLNIPTPPIVTTSDTAGGLLDEFNAAREHDEPMMEDTIMADFLTVDDMHSKPDTPATSVEHAVGSGPATATAEEEMFTITPHDDSVDDGTLDFVADLEGGASP